MLGTFFLLLIAAVSTNAYYANETNCSKATTCDECSKLSECLYCGSLKENRCVSISTILMQNGSLPHCEIVGWCQGTGCGCGMFPTPTNVGSMIVIMIIYGVILGAGAKMIADGSEDLLEVFPDHSTLIGGLLLPVLGVVPDGTMILVSGLFGSREEAQEQVAVGMGTLAGSTIMLLTIPWSASLVIARTDLKHGESVDGQLTAPLSKAFTHTGVTVDYDTMINARIAIGTSLFFLFVVAFFYLSNETDKRAEELESKVSLAGFVVCMVGFVSYIVYQLYVPQLAEKRKQKAEKHAQEKKQVLTALLIVKNLRDLAGHVHEAKSPEHKEQHAKALALQFGKKLKLAAGKKKTEESPLTEEAPPSPSINVEPSDVKVAAEEAEESQSMSLFKSFGQMIIGALLVTLFSDPMVDAITLLGKEWNIGAFYISFIVTPFCSNASELIAALVFAANKNQQANSMTYSQLYGAATMNSTLGLAIFYALIHFRGLAWTFSAETLAILLITWLVCLSGAFKRTFSLAWIFPNMALYPLSLLFVWLLEHYAKWT